jgi:hypothetical protein
MKVKTEMKRKVGQENEEANKKRKDWGKRNATVFIVF